MLLKQKVANVRFCLVKSSPVLQINTCMFLARVLCSTLSTPLSIKVLELEFCIPTPWC